MRSSGVGAISFEMTLHRRRKPSWEPLSVAGCDCVTAAKHRAVASHNCGWLSEEGHALKTSPGSTHTKQRKPTTSTCEQRQSCRRQSTNPAHQKPNEMPKQVHDIKQFIELCRRKDAKSMFFPTITRKQQKLTTLDYSCPHKGRFSLFCGKFQRQEVIDAELKRSKMVEFQEKAKILIEVYSEYTEGFQGLDFDQIQSPMPPSSLHPRPQRCREG